jgi:hypothetical protein
MPRRGQGFAAAAFLNPIHQDAGRDGVVRRSHGPRKIAGLVVYVFDPEHGVWQSDPLNLPLQKPAERTSGLE